MINDISHLLNEAQLKPALHKDGPMMVIAGAGSGKTRVLTYRIAHLLSEGIDSFSILALTFTNKAAREMKDRIAKIVGESESRNLWMGTFHSVFARILRSEAHYLGYPNSFSIYDIQDSEKLISSIIKEFKLNKDIYKFRQIRARISSYKNSLITVKAYFNNQELQEYDRESKRPELGKIYKEYVERCFKAGAMDFDDLLLKTNELLNLFPEVLFKYQEKFKYILVDEYQDTNHSQYLIVKSLADKYQNLCVVGDDSQSIYAFRGANIQNILNFSRDYPNSITYRLEQNYRSTKNIVNTANALINRNQNKLEKKLWTDNPEGDKVVIQRCPTDTEEGRFVSENIFETSMQYQLSYDDFAVLYRTNAQSRSIEDSLRKRNIPYRVYGGVSFYQRKEIKDILAYLRLIVNSNDEESLKRIINYPTRGIGQTTIDKLILATKSYDCSLYNVIEKINDISININNGTKSKLISFYTMIESLKIQSKKLNAYDLAFDLTRKIGIIDELKKDMGPESISRIENVEELLNGIRDFVDGQMEIVDAKASIVEFLEDVTLATDFDNEIVDKKSVSLMTVHLAKGLEFKNIYIIGLEEDLFPSAMSINSREDLEEERRLFYVAITRAQERLNISYALSRFRWGKIIDSDASRFLGELDESCISKRGVGLKSNSNNSSYIDSNIFDNNPIRFFKPKIKKSSTKKLKIVPPKSKMKSIKNFSNKTEINLTSLKVGDIVSHSRFGKGEIKLIDGTDGNLKAVVDFFHSGEKSLLLRFAKLKVLSDED